MVPRTVEKEIIKQRELGKNCVRDDNEAADMIVELLKDTFINVDGKYYYKEANCWINNKQRVDSLVLLYVTEKEIFKLNSKFEPEPYSQNVHGASNIIKLVYAKIRVRLSNIEYNLFHSTTKKKLCFLDGVLNFETKKFTLWVDLEETVYTTVVIKRNFKSYFDNPDRHFIDKIKNDIFSNLYGSKTDLALKFFSRAIAGCNEDKIFMSYSGNRNCGKGVQYSLMENAFGDYVKSFNLENMLCDRQSKKSSDLARENSWIMDLEFARAAVSQETEDNENDDIKKELKVSNKVMKSLLSGGDSL